MTETKMQLEDWLDDLCVRFIINLPEEDLSSVARICFQVEEAQWFYEDFIRPLDPTLPSMSLRSFCLRIFQHCPLLSAFSADNHMQAFEEFLTYKTRVPVRGAIMLNHAMDSVVLVKGWKKGANWSFPRGKINKDEDDLDCAVREVYEETGYDIREAGLVPKEDDVKYIEITMREQHMRLYVFRDVPMDTHFEPRTRKEISKIEWYRLSDLPAFRKKTQGHQDDVEAAVNANKFYMVAPFLVPLKKWVVQQKKKDAQRMLNNQYLATGFPDDIATEEEQGPDKGHACMPESAPEHETMAGHGLGIDTMAGATAALHRLLKIQPPTQGLQPEAASVAPSPVSQNSGEALLALLQSKPRRDENPAPLPQTPIDLTITKPQLPRTPQHQQIRPAQYSSMPTAPSFPIQPSGGIHQYGAPLHQIHPPMNTQHSMGPPPIFQPGRNQFQQHTNFQRTQSQQLQHPQPLPPQVTRAVFTEGQLHAPTTQQFPNQPLGPLPNERGVQNTTQPHFHNVHRPGLSATPKVSGQNLTSHSLALLNAFKNKDQFSTANDHGVRQSLQTSQNEVTPVHARDHKTGSFQGVTENMPEMSGIGMLSTHSSHGKPVANEQHRSSLLDMFKGGNIMPPTPSGHGSSTTVLPTQQITDEEPKGKEVSKEENPPFRPVAILTRTPRDILPSDQSQTRPNTHGGEPMPLLSRNAVRLPLNSVQARLGKEPIVQTNPPKDFQPQILKRPEIPQQPVSHMPAELAASSPPAFSAHTMSPSLDHRGGHPTEQRETLLSLFGRLPAASPSAPDSGVLSETPEPRLGFGTALPTRSRVSSLASVRGDALSNSSRRGSQNTISPAHKDFLLGYLNSVGR